MFSGNYLEEVCCLMKTPLVGNGSGGNLETSDPFNQLQA